MRQIWRSKSVLAGLFSSSVFMVLVALSVWQVQRLHWKEKVLAHYDAGQHAAPRPVDRFNDLETLPEFTPVHLKGYLALDYACKLVPRSAPKAAGAAQEMGYHLVAPLRVDAKTYILAELGFVANEISLDTAVAQLRDKTRGAPVRLTGMLRAFHPPGRFTPPPNGRELYLMSPDVPLLQGLRATQTLIGTVYLRALSAQFHPQSANFTRTILKPLPWPERPRNQHLQYAITWAALALVWGGLCIYYYSRARRDR